MFEKFNKKVDTVTSTIERMGVSEVSLGDAKINKKLVVFHSSSAGSGATTMVNLAAKMIADKDLTVVVVDLNDRSRNTNICATSTHSINNYLSGQGSIQNYINSTDERNVKYIGPSDGDEMLEFMPLVLNNAYVDLIRNKLDNMFTTLYDVFDCILVDCGNFLDVKSFAAANFADRQYWLCDNTARGLLYLESDLYLLAEDLHERVEVVTVDRHWDVDTTGMYSNDIKILTGVKHSAAMEEDIVQSVIPLYTNKTKPRDVAEAMYMQGIFKIVNEICGKE